MSRVQIMFANESRQHVANSQLAVVWMIDGAYFLVSGAIRVSQSSLSSPNDKIDLSLIMCYWMVGLLRVAGVGSCYDDLKPHQICCPSCGRCYLFEMHHFSCHAKKVAQIICFDLHPW